MNENTAVDILKGLVESIDVSVQGTRDMEIETKHEAELVLAQRRGEREAYLEVRDLVVQAIEDLI